ncbi:MAG: choice-of-anchor J domain-containing protein, partial [Thermoplasmatales archaeon]|nr:choice-of-anchor J domain-containing protein [Thermoplasmatales archaeon]
IAENLSTYNGYTVMQSGNSYLTTGDTDDWIYGYSKYVLGDPTYPFTIELDTSFQPPTSQIPITCEKHIGVNLYLAEIADNPAQEYPGITHTPLLDTKNTTGPYRVIATITSNAGLNSSALKLIWKTSTVSDTTVTLSPTGNPDEYYADIPGQTDGTWVYYYIYAEDSGGNKSSSPETKKWESQKTHKFYVGQDRVTYTIYNLASNATKTVNLTVTSPGTALPEETANIKVIVTSQNNSLKKDSVTTTTTIMPGILLADDTNGGNITGFKTALNNAGYKYDVKTAEGSTGFSGVLSKYPIVIWVCKGTTTLSDVDKQNLRFYLNGGGNLFISGEDIGYDIAGDIDGFYQNYLHANYIADDSNINNLDGVTGDPIGDGFTNINITGSYPSEIAPYDVNATVIFKYTGSIKNASIKVDTGIYKVVYFACMYFEGPDAAANKDIIMDRIIKWFKPANDVGVQKINEPVNGNTYDVGEMTINAEIVNYGSNQQSDFNVSCEIEEVTQPEQVITIFSDGFETDLSKWTVSPSGKWVRSTTYANSGSYSAKCLYDANSTDYNLISNNIDLSSATNADFEYYFRGSSENTYDKLFVEIKRTTETTWTILAQYTGTSYESAWTKGSVDISSYTGSIVQVRFRFHTDSSILSGESWYIDDVAVSKTTPPVTQIVYDSNQTITTILAQYSTKSISWSYNFRNTTDYRVNIKTWLATDGAKGNDEKTVAIKITMSFTFSFKNGWNFITIPVNTTYERAGDIVNAVNYCTHVMRWNA